MTFSDWHYTPSDLVAGLQEIGIGHGDTIFVHVCLDRLGQPRGCSTSEQVCELLLSALQEAVGVSGTILVPTYTFSFCRQEIFDIQNTPTAGGPWSTSADFLEYFRRIPGAIRSADPIHSVSGLGPQTTALLTDLPNTCFGADSVHDW